MIIVGITGTLGAGKGTIVEYFVKERDFRHYSAREFITREIKKRGLPVNRDTMTAVGNDLREKHGSGFVIEELYKEAKNAGENAVIESIRTVGEITAMRKHENFILFAVNADPQVRYERITQRGTETDRILYEQFLSDEKRESISEDPAKQNLSKCIAHADHIFQNNGTIQDLHNHVADVLKQYATR